MGLKKDKSSEVHHADDADCGSLRAKNVVCDKSHISASQSDNAACMNDVVACSSGSSENNMGNGTSDNTSNDPEMLLESNVRELVSQNQLSSKLAHSSNENLAYNKHSGVLGPSKNEEVSARATESGEIDHLPSCTELEKNKPCSSAVGTCNDQEKVQGIIDQTPSCSMELQVDAALDAADPLLDKKVIHEGSNSQASAKGQTGKNDVDGQPLIDSFSSCDPDEKAHQYNVPDQFVEVKKHPLISPVESEGDDADLEEQDVKVCDICGDAGREDLLAICSRCSDGAEHTYCMREMLDEVPEGDWLCEECKACEEMERKRRGDSEILGGRERSKRISDSLQEKKDPSLAGIRANNDSLTRHLTNKRRGSDIEVDPVVKKQVLESMVQSPTTSSPARDGALSRDNSFKNKDKMNAKLTHQASISGRDNLEKPRSPNASLSNVAKGSYLKSNSFGASSSVPKVKMVVEIPQKHKQGVDVKDASSKILSKSVPFKGSLSRSNTSESKVKMLSPKDSHILESRGLKQAKDRNLFERKNSIKLDHSAASQLAVNGCKNQLRGEVRRQQSSYPSGGGSSSSDVASGSADAKSSLSLKEGCASNLSRLDGVSSEKNLDRSSNHSRQSVGDATLQSSALDTSSVRSLKDGVNEENKLKAAIQAAMQKRLDMGKRSKGPDKSNVVSVSNVDSVGERATIDRPNSLRNSVSAEGMHEAGAASPSCSLNSVKETSVSNVNQSKVLPADSVDSLQAKNMDSVSSDVEQILRRSAIPDHEFAWIGSFEVYRGGSTPEQISGVQAHLSTCASYKVLEMVKKFPQKVSLSEVPRSCTWPAQFQDGGAEEDNIAVYFFAKDAESYERSYKNLLEKLMKDDLALKGNIDGIDLLIFPSKQLTKRSQRWNMLFFIWGVFRCKKENCWDNNSGYVEKLDLSSLSTCKAVTSDFMSPLEKPSLDGNAKVNISTTKSDQDLRGHNSFDSGVLLAKESPRFSNGDRYLGEHSPHKTNSYVMKKFGHHEARNERESACDYPEACCGTRYKSTLVQVECGDPDDVKVAECQTTSSHSERCRDSSVKVEMMLADPSPAQKITFDSGSSENETEAKVKDEKAEVKIKETVKGGGCPMKLQSNLNKEETCVNDQGQIELQDNSRHEEQCKEKENYRVKVMEGKLKQDEVNVKKIDFGGNIDQQQLLQRKHDCPPTIAGLKKPLNDINVAFDEEIAKERVGSSIRFCGPDDIHSSTSTAVEKRSKLVSDKEAERFFFPVNLNSSASMPRDDSLCCSSSKVADGFPNLELALGVENRTAKSGFFLGLVDDHRVQPNSPNVGRRKEDEASSAALSLSLAFPFGERDRSASEEFPGK